LITLLTLSLILKYLKADYNLNVIAYEII